MLRTFSTFFVVLLFGCIFGPLCLLLNLFRKNQSLLYWLGRIGCQIGLTVAGIKVEVQGLEFLNPNQNYLFLANHQSYCDPPAIISTIPLNLRLILKKELKQIPLLGIIMNKGGFIFINRYKRIESFKNMANIVDQLQKGYSFLIYPEGTRTRTGHLGAFKKGIFALAINSKVPIIPITVSGGYAIMPPSSFSIKSGTIKLTLNRPILTTEFHLKDRHLLMNQVRKTIIENLQTSEKPNFDHEQKKTVQEVH